MIKRVAFFGAAALLAALPPAVSGQPPANNTYVVTQAYCLEPQTKAPRTQPGKCYPQSLPIASTLEVQLPGNPSVWEVSSAPDTLKLIGLTKLQSPGRVDGASEIYIFQFATLTQGSRDLVFKETPPLLSKQAGGTFTFRVTVK